MPLTPTDIVSAPLLHAGHPVPSRDRIVNGLLFIPLYQYRDSNRITRYQWIYLFLVDHGGKDRSSLMNGLAHMS